MSKMLRGMQRMLTGLLAMAMIVTSMPVSALAGERAVNEDPQVETAVMDESIAEEATVDENVPEESEPQAEEAVEEEPAEELVEESAEEEAAEELPEEENVSEAEPEDAELLGDGTYHVSFQFDPEAVTVTAEGFDDIEHVNVEPDSTVRFTAVANKGYNITLVMYNEETMLTPDENSVYTIGGIDGDSMEVLIVTEAVPMAKLTYDPQMVTVSEATPELDKENMTLIGNDGIFKFKAEPKPGYQIRYVLEDNERPINKNAEGYYVVDEITGHTEIEIEAGPAPVSVKFNLNGATLYRYLEGEGRGSELSPDEAGVLPVDKQKDFSFSLEVPEDSRIVAVKVGTKTLQVKDEGRGSYYTIDGSDLRKNTTVTVTTRSIRITSVSLKGFSNNKVTQVAGTTAEYPITINKDGDIDRLAFALVDGTGENATVQIDKENKKLIVKTAKLETTPSPKLTIQTEPFTLRFTDNDSGIDGAEFTINPTFKIAKPAVKVTSVSDVDVTLSLTAPKNCPTNAYYMITANGKDVPAGMKSTVTSSISTVDIGGEWVSTASLSLADDPTPGAGKAAKYDFSVSIVQVKNFTGDAGTDLVEENRYGVSDAAKVSTATLDPCYEVKLALNRKTTTFPSGQKDILLATAKYSAKTTFRQLGKAEIMYASGITVSSSQALNPVLKIEGDEILLKDSTTFEPGKYTLKVYPFLPDGTYATPATVPLTLQMPITGVNVSIPSEKVYFTGSKNVSFKATAILNGGFKESAPASKKIKWTVVDASSNPAPDTVTVKNGTVTISKNYVMQDAPEKNTFYVVAQADDMADNPFDANDRKSFTITKDAIKFGKIQIGSVSDFKDPVLSSSLLNTGIQVFDENATLISPLNYTLKVNDEKNFVIKYNAMVSEIKKAGKYTLTVTATDGGKASIKQVIEVKAANAESYAFSVSEFKEGGNLFLVDPNNYQELQAGDEEGEFYPKNYGNGYFLLKSTAATDAASVFTNAASFKLRNAVKVTEWLSGDGLIRYQVVKAGNSADSFTVTHSYKIGKDSKNEIYTIRTGLKKDVTFKAAKEEKLQFYANAINIAYQFGFSTEGEIASPDKVSVRFLPSEDAVKNPDLSRFAMDLCGYKQLTLENNVLTISYEPYRFLYFPKGNYKVYAMLYDTNNKTCLTGLVPLTFKAVAAKKPTAKNAVTAKKPVEILDKAGAYARIPITLKDSPGFDLGSVVLMNNNLAGTVNQFTRYFYCKVGYINGEGALVSSYDSDKPIGLYLFRKDVSGIKEEDFDGWITYSVIGEDRITETVYTDHIYVKFKPAD